MFLTLDRFVTNVAEHLLAVLIQAHQKVCLATFRVNRFASRASSAQLDIDVRVVVKTHKLVDHLVGHRWRQKCFLLLEALRVLLEMHLALGWDTTCPTHPTVALSALYVSAATVVLTDRHAALDIRTGLSAMFHE